MSDINLVNELHDLIFKMFECHAIYDMGESGAKCRAVVFPEKFLLDIKHLNGAVEAFREGDFAFSSGQGLEFNPHDEDANTLHKYWIAGHEHRNQIHREEMEKIDLKYNFDTLKFIKKRADDESAQLMESLRNLKNKILTAPKFRPMSRKDILLELSTLHIYHSAEE